MQTKGVTQDENGNFGIWRTIKKIGKIFIQVGETSNDAVARKTKEWLSMSIDKLKKQQAKQPQERLRSKVMDKISTVRNELEENEKSNSNILHF